jgi:membrane-bound lytic murein transglycosylase D
MYFPIIERVFKEEGLPEDFKYLVLQESGLISDAVSSSNAVGFWQFKKAAATEVGLRVDRIVDERLNIVSSTRGAAKYIKKNNRLYFDNWVHALLAYQQGPGGAQKLVNKKYQGSRSMPIDSQTHWYVIKFLAHKIAFEQVKSVEPKLFLAEYYEGQGQTIKDIARQHRLDHETVMNYNKWLKHGKVPTDKPYAVILPYNQAPAMLASKPSGDESIISTRVQELDQWQYQTHPDKYPTIKTYRNPSKGIKINGIKGVRLQRDMDYKTLQETTGVPIKRLLSYNDVTNGKKPGSGELWYLKRKGSRAQEQYHVVEPGEDLWSISQKYGVRLSRLRKMNRMSRRQSTVKPGRLLWLQSTRPKDVPVVYKPEEKPAAASKPAAKPVEPPRNTASNSTKSDKKVHVVQPGQTLYGISKQYQVSIADLRKWNSLLESDVLSIGQQVIVNTGSLPPAGTLASEPVEPKFELYQVKAGDTLYQIARDHDATIKELMEWNQKSDFNLSVGEQLRVVMKP